MLLGSTFQHFAEAVCIYARGSRVCSPAGPCFSSAVICRSAYVRVGRIEKRQRGLFLPASPDQLSIQIALASGGEFANILSSFVSWNKVLSNYMLIIYPVELTRHHPFERSWFFLSWRTAIYPVCDWYGNVWSYHVFTVWSVQKSSGEGPSCVLESSNLYLWFLVVVLAVDLLIFVVVPFKDQALVSLIFLFSALVFLCFLGIYIYFSISVFIRWKLKLFILDASCFLLSFNILHSLLMILLHLTNFATLCFSSTLYKICSTFSWDLLLSWCII